jgi:general secretion pathway protein N
MPCWPTAPVIYLAVGLSRTLLFSTGKREMIERRKTIGFALVPCLILTVGWALRCYAGPIATIDITPNDVGATSNQRPNLRNLRLPTGNPLWSVPLSGLTATRARPIFSASRRLAAPAAMPRVEPVVAPVVQRTPEPERPSLALIGSVIGDRKAVAVFVDATTQGIVRLRVGEAHAGWALSSVLRREATLSKAGQVEVLVLQLSNGAAAIPGWAAPPAPAAAAPAPADSILMQALFPNRQ